MADFEFQIEVKQKLYEKILSKKTQKEIIKRAPEDSVSSIEQFQ